MGNPRDDFRILRNNNKRVEQIFYEEGKLFCPAFDDGIVASHNEPLLFVESNGLCTSQPPSGSLVFASFPNGEVGLFKHDHPIEQREISEVVVICGVCRSWLKKKISDFKEASSKKKMQHFSWFGIQNDHRPADPAWSLVRRITHYPAELLDSPDLEKPLKNWMLKPLDKPFDVEENKNITE